MSSWILPAAAALLIVERACYVWIARWPAAFQRLCARPGWRWLGKPVLAVGRLFAVFKVVQAGTFAWWWAAHSDANGLRLASEPLPLGLGLALIAAGQGLNASVFHRLGLIGVFYGDRFGYTVPWCRAFPFSILAHPQYVGAVMTIWGVFLAMELASGAWYQLPVIETVYYTVSTLLEKHSEEGCAPLPNLPPETSCAGEAGARTAVTQTRA